MVRIGIFGLGTVGRGVLEIIRSRKLPIEVAAIVDRSYLKKKDIIGDIPASDDPSLILNDSSIEVIVELMGGIDLPLYIVREALDHKKNVITANKFLLAEHGYPLFSKARENGVRIGYEAAVAGAIPVIRNLQNIFQYEEIPVLEGILNGTTNYILTRMRKEKIGYQVALAEAQKLGLAEADPYLDVSGYDAAHKLALLASLLSGKWVEYHHIHVAGVDQVNLTDILWAEKMGYRIRLVARYQNKGGLITLSVEPTFIGPGHYLWDVEMEKNAIFFKGEFSGGHLFLGKGAGSLPTAYSVVSDMMHYLQGNHRHDADSDQNWPYAHPVSLDEEEAVFYIRFSVSDKTGVLAILTRILSEHNISIASVHQDIEIPNEGEVAVDEPVDLMLVTHKCRRKTLKAACLEIEKLDTLKGSPVLMPVDGQL